MEPNWIMGLAGGLVIGLAASFYLLVNGRIMGASGLLGDLIDGSDRRARTENAAFLAGLVGVPGLIGLWRGATTHLTGDLAVVVAAGLLVGFGARLANGCTSGHGVCGISRLAPRGIAATLAYLAAGAVTLWVMRHLLGLI